MESKRQNVLLFGTGIMAEKIVKEVLKKYDIVGFLDNSIEKQNRYWESSLWKIYAPEEHGKLQFDKIVLASTAYAAQMYTQLLKIGIKEHNIIVDYVCKTAEVYIDDFLSMQIDQWGDFNRADIAVKYFAIESYMWEKNEGIELYKKMQQERLKLTDVQAAEAWNKFKKLIDSVRKNGYEKDSYIVCDEAMKIMDGAHRVALCLYFNILTLPVKITPQKYENDYRIEWFWNHKFFTGEIHDIEKKIERITKSDRKDLVAFIWPPAMKFCEIIKEEISKFVKIKRAETKHLTDDKLPDFIRAVYSVDDIESWKVEKKIEHMRSYGNTVEVLFLLIDKPKYRLKGSTSLPLSVKVEELKKIIRGRFQDRVDNYFYDNIIHISDNYYQSKLVDKILKLHPDITECFVQIKDIEYVLCKLDVPYMVCDFPKSFPIHKDADLLCKRESYAELVGRIKAFALSYAEDNGLAVRVLEESVRTKIRIEYIGFLIYQFDISFEIENLGEGFVNDAVNRRIWRNGIYMLDEPHEIEVRKNECILYPGKEHHKRYLLDHGVFTYLVGK